MSRMSAWSPRTLPRNLRLLFRFLIDTLRAWKMHHPELLAAGLGYFALFSLTPVLVISTALLGSIWSRSVVQSRVLTELSVLLGPDAADSIGHWMKLTTSTDKTKATAFSAVILYLAASRLFAQVRVALNIIWDVVPKRRPLLRRVARTVALNFLMVLGVGLFLFVFLVSDAALAVASRSLGAYTPTLIGVLKLVSIVVPPALFAVLFACTYKYVPETPVAWRDVWPGALFTSMLFAVGKGIMAVYFAYQSFSSVYGAASSVIVIMVWIYFAARIFFYGASFTRMYAERYGSRVHRPLI
jgi:membrane protein